jgi:hypothetical protein
MADLTVTAANLRPMEGIEARLIPMIADEAITKGQPVYRKTNGKAGVARANAVGTSKLVGIATTSVATSQNPGTTIYLSITATGLLADAAAVGTGNVVVPVGTVHCMTDQDLTKFLFVDIPQNAPTGTAL